MWMTKEKLTNTGFYWYSPHGETDSERGEIQLIGLALKYTASGEKYFLCEMNYHGNANWSFEFGRYVESDEVGEHDLFTEIRKPELPPGTVKKG